MALKQPAWPINGSAAAWVRCTADWALLLSPDSRDRCYAHFALRAHAEAGRRRDVDLLARRLLPPKSRQARDLATVATNYKVIAEAYLIVGDDVKAGEQLEAMRQLAARQRKDGDAQFLLDLVSEVCTDHGLVTAEQLVALAPDDRVSSELALADRAWKRRDRVGARRHALVAAKVAGKTGSIWQVFALLLDVGAKRDALAIYRKATPEQREDFDLEAMVAAGLQRQAVAATKAEVEAAFRELVPGEWNVHRVMGSLRIAIDRLRVLERDDLARMALDVAVDRMASGQFDARGFASGVAHVYLAEMVFAQRGWPAAEPWLARALAVCGSRDRPLVVPAMVEAASNMDQVDRALEWVVLAPKNARLALRAKVLARARRWKALRQVLAPLGRGARAAQAAKLAWSLTPPDTDCVC